jgi:hypothetical protein
MEEFRTVACAFFLVLLTLIFLVLWAIKNHLAAIEGYACGDRHGSINCEYDMEGY